MHKLFIKHPSKAAYSNATTHFEGNIRIQCLFSVQYMLQILFLFSNRPFLYIYIYIFIIFKLSVVLISSIALLFNIPI